MGAASQQRFLPVARPHLAPLSLAGPFAFRASNLPIGRAQKYGAKLVCSVGGDASVSASSAKGLFWTSLAVWQKFMGSSYRCRRHCCQLETGVTNKPVNELAPRLMPAQLSAAGKA